MTDRATYLAKVLITELTQLEIGLLDDAGPLDVEHETTMRRYTVAKVLAAEVGLTDDISISRVVEFMPRVIPGAPTPDHEYAQLATLLRNNLRLDYR